MADEIKKADADKKPDVKATERKADERKVTEERNKRDKDDMTPVPSQAELDGIAGGDKDRKAEPRQAPEALPPTPTQAENDDYMLKASGIDPAKLEKQEAKEPRAAPLPPTPTQAENDAAKLAACNAAPPDEPPPEENGTRSKDEPHTQAQRRQIEAGKPSAGYETRSTSAATPHAPTPHPAKAE